MANRARSTRWSSAPMEPTLASAGADRVVRIWDVATGELRATLHGHSAAVFGLAFSPDGKLLASASADRTIRCWDLATGRQLQVLEGHTNWVMGVAFSPDGAAPGLRRRRSDREGLGDGPRPCSLDVARPARPRPRGRLQPRRVALGRRVG